MNRLDPRKFDPAKPLAMGRFNTVGGHALAVGDKIMIVADGEEPKERGEVTLDTATRLWSSGTFVYAEDAKPTPTETEEQSIRREAEIEELDGGKFMLRSPMLGAAETFDDRASAEARIDELVAAGYPKEGAPAAPANIPGGQPGQQEQGEAGSKDERIAALVDGNTEVQLRDRITAINESRLSADPDAATIEAKGDHNKTDLARLIVEADGDVEPPKED